MTFGVRINDASGVVFQSDMAQGGVVIDVFITSGSGDSRTYPDFSGRSVFAALASGFTSGYVLSVDYSLGYPRLMTPAGWGGLTVLVFAK